MHFTEFSSRERTAYACKAGQWRTRDFFSGGGGSTNSVEGRGQRERGSGGGVAPYSGVLEAAVIWYRKFHFIQ